MPLGDETMPLYAGGGQADPFTNPAYMKELHLQGYDKIPTEIDLARRLPDLSRAQIKAIRKQMLGYAVGGSASGGSKPPPRVSIRAGGKSAGHSIGGGRGGGGNPLSNAYGDARNANLSRYNDILGGYNSMLNGGGGGGGNPYAAALAAYGQVYGDKMNRLNRPSLADQMFSQLTGFQRAGGHRDREANALSDQYLRNILGIANKQATWKDPNAIALPTPPAAPAMTPYTPPERQPVLGSYATGTPFVPQTGNYQLHQGEAVVPAPVNPYNTSYRPGPMGTGGDVLTGGFMGGQPGYPGGPGSPPSKLPGQQFTTGQGLTFPGADMNMPLRGASRTPAQPALPTASPKFPNAGAPYMSRQGSPTFNTGFRANASPQGGAGRPSNPTQTPSGSTAGGSSGNQYQARQNYYNDAERRINELAGQYGSRQDEIMNMLKGYGNQQKQDILQRGRNAESAALQDASGRGFTGTTLQAGQAMARAGTEADMRRAEENLQRMRTGLASDLSGDTLGFQSDALGQLLGLGERNIGQNRQDFESDRAFNEGNYRFNRTQGFDENRWGNEFRRGNFESDRDYALRQWLSQMGQRNTDLDRNTRIMLEKLGFMERRNDVYPDVNNALQMVIGGY